METLIKIKMGYFYITENRIWDVFIIIKIYDKMERLPSLIYIETYKRKI